MSQLMDVGTWMCEVVEHGFSKAQTGTNQFFVVFKNEHDDEITHYSTMGHKKDGTLSEKAFEFFVRELRAMGFEPDDHGWDLRILGRGECLLGARVEVVVENEEYGGKTRRKVKWINDPNSRRERQSLDPAEENAFFKNLRAHAFSAGLAKPGATRTAPAARPAPAPAPSQPQREMTQGYREAAEKSHAGIDYDDIPFAWLLPFLVASAGMLA